VEQPRPGGFGGDAPTIESPALAVRDDALRARIAATGARHDAATEATSELSLDDLGFDAQSLGAGADSIPSLAATDHPADAPTMIASLDDRSRVLLEKAAQRAPRADLEATRESPRPYVDDDLTQLAAAIDRTAAHRGGAEYEKTEQLSLDAGDTGAARVLGGGGDLDLDLDELAKALESDTVEQPRRDDLAFSTDVFATGRQRANGAARGALDLDVGAAAAPAEREPTVTERINVDDLALPELEPVTLSEVGTKLDLARAYMDMGDPDGARSILQEVLGEGSASQKQEAQRLIETLPG
jgi:pilus assembly protein FimV